MSRIGKVPIQIPQDVSVQINANNMINVVGKNGTLSFEVPKEVVIKIDESQSLLKLTLSEENQSKKSSAMWGLSRSIVNNMVLGVSKCFVKELEILGVGLKCSLNKSGQLLLSLGLSHEILYNPPKGIKLKCDKPTSVSITGIDRALVGDVAAKIRSLKVPEPYKGKGIRYLGEKVRRKEGKKK